MADGVVEAAQQQDDWDEAVAPFDEFKSREEAGFADEYTKSFIERLRSRESEA